MHCAGAIAAEDHRLLAHARDEEIARIGNLAFVPDEQPGTGEDALLLLGIDVVVDEDLAAYLAGCKIDETGTITPCSVHRHRSASPQKKNVRFLVSSTF